MTQPPISARADAPLPETPNSGGTSRRRRIIGVSVVGALFVAWCVTVGLPTDPILASIWLWVLTIGWNNGRHWTHHLRFLRDWLPVLIFLVLYSYSRGWAYTSTTVPHVYEMLAIDHAIFGVTPTVWLQQHLYDPNHIHPWDVAVSFVYFSHFVTVYIVAAVLWLRNRSAWAAFMRRWMLLTFAGVATYILWPAAPPWWAAKYGLIEPVARLSSRGFNALGLHGAGNMLNHAQLGANPVAAMPSLHFAFSLCVAGFFMTQLRKRWIPLLALYPLAMAFTLSYCGEHHVTDMIAGALYVLASFVLVSVGERLWRRRRTRRLLRTAETIRADAGADRTAAPVELDRTARPADLDRTAAPVELDRAAEVEAGAAPGPAGTDPGAGASGSAATAERDPAGAPVSGPPAGRG
ncbi:phosphatidic acid phosphatase [Actinocatenispora thailandica]|uniref:Phosphatidic acid phosphatase n=1 Tax=Actinocatenispora thailandica TaxID=227318 RepID=A0A7R7DQ42_9ACTN|nr:phosphatase PAP2 family protein [Actinocatenispora thailandica]BCJ35820.1 phosphatidic acid phosphatase [Actinocatenispora thailandica]